MRTMLFVAMLATASATYAADPAVTTAPTAVAVVSAIPTDGEKMICRREPTIGSNARGKKICKRKSEIDAAQIAGRDSAKQLSTPTGGGSSSN